MKIASFFGHRDFDNENIKEKIKKKIIEYIEKEGVDTFYLGGRGRFDWFCANLVKEIKNDYPYIKSNLVLSYLTNKIDDNDKKMIEKIYDGTIYPPLESVPHRFAIIKRNEWIVQQSDIIFFYVKYSWGGANSALVYAKKKQKKYINFAE